MKMTHKFFALPVLMGALLIAGTTQNAHAADTANVSLNVPVLAAIDVETNANASFTADRDAYDRGYIEQAGAINVKVFANKNYTVKVKGTDGASLKNEDLYVRYGSDDYAVVNPDTAQPVFTGTPTDDADIEEGQDHDIDVKVMLPTTSKYPAGGTYTNTLTFTIVTN